MSRYEDGRWVKCRQNLRNSRAQFVRTLRRGISGALVIGVLSVAGCASAPSDDGASETAIDLPNSAVGNQAAWVLEVVNAPEPVAEEHVTQHLAKVMFDDLKVSDFVGVFEQLRADRPWISTEYNEKEDQAVVKIVGARGPALEMSISLDSAGMVNGLFFAPAKPERTPAADWKQLEKAVQGLPASTSLNVTKVTDQPETILAVGDDSMKPIGSIFKLYVLAAVVYAVEDGSLSWDSTLTVTDDVRSLPSGKLQDAPTGTVVTVREGAELMISISDNTAADMLMAAVGRDAVENAQARLGHHDPAANTPFLTTREMFQLGWGERAGAADEWDNASVAERSTILAQLPHGVLNIAPTAVTEPVWQHGLDWFANAADLRAAHLGLQELASTEAGEPVRKILAMNPGAGMTFGDKWTYVGFKGGSSAGELAGSWYVERADGELFTLSLQAASDDPADLVDIREYFAQIEDALALLADR